MQKSSGEIRSFRNNLLIACFTAFTAGMTNIAGIPACHAFTSNVTGHTVVFPQHMISGSFFELSTVFSWILLFILGAGISHFLIRSYEQRGPHFAFAVPLILEVVLLLLVAIYGNHYYDETDWEVFFLSITLLFAMGIQNGAINSISEGKIKTSHLTGLSTDLGNELAEWLHPKTGSPQELKRKPRLRGNILLFYILGAFIGGWSFLIFGFNSFYIIAVIICVLIVVDLREIRKDRLKEDSNQPPG